MMKTKTFPYLEGEKHLSNVISPLLNDKLITTKLFSLKLWKPGKRDQKLVSPAQLTKQNKTTHTKKASHSTKLHKRYWHRRTKGCLTAVSVSMVWGCRKTAPSAVKSKYHLVWIFYIIFTIAAPQAHPCALSIEKALPQGTALICRRVWASKRWHQIGTIKHGQTGMFGKVWKQYH